MSIHPEGKPPSDLGRVPVINCPSGPAGGGIKDTHSAYVAYPPPPYNLRVSLHEQTPYGGRACSDLDCMLDLDDPRVRCACGT
jgi:hypothetical protein